MSKLAVRRRWNLLFAGLLSAAIGTLGSCGKVGFASTPIRMEVLVVDRSCEITIGGLETAGLERATVVAKSGGGATQIDIQGSSGETVASLRAVLNAEGNLEVSIESDRRLEIRLPRSGVTDESSIKGPLRRESPGVYVMSPGEAFLRHQLHSPPDASP